MKILDPHIHLFALEEGIYEWLKPANPPHWLNKHKIHRNYNESELKLLAPLSLAGYVHIEAGFNNHASWHEVAYWQKQAQLPIKAIQNADLTAHPDKFTEDLSKGLENESMVGVRNIIENKNILSHAHTPKNIRLLVDSNLIFELQIDLSDKDLTPRLFALLDELPSLHISLNHVGFIPARNTLKYQQWQSAFRALLGYPNLLTKLSGLEMHQNSIGLDDILFSLDACLNIIDDQRLAIASNFPVVSMVLSYQAYWQLICDACNRLGVNEQRLMHDCAHRFYFDRKVKALNSCYE